MYLLLQPNPFAPSSLIINTFDSPFKSPPTKQKHNEGGGLLSNFLNETSEHCSHKFYILQSLLPYSPMPVVAKATIAS